MLLKRFCKTSLSSSAVLALVLFFTPQVFGQSEPPGISQPSASALPAGGGGPAGGGSAEINVKNADIAAVVRIFGKKTKRNYILDERVKGKISIYLPGRVSSEDSIKILETILALKGFSSVPVTDNLWKIIPAKEAIKSTVPTLTDSGVSPTAAVVTRLLPLKFVSADDAKEILSPLVSANGLISAYTGTNSLLIVDSEDNIDRLVGIINSMDVPFSNQEMTILTIKNADAVEVAEKLNQILGEGKEDTGQAGATRAQLRGNIPGATNAVMRTGQDQSGAATSMVTEATISARVKAPKIIPDERTNAIIVVADEDTTARIEALVEQLDSEIDLSGFRFYVYRCQYANAGEVAEVLSGLTGQSMGSTSGQSSFGSSFQRQGRNTGSLERGNRFMNTQDRLTSQQRTPGRSRSENAEGGDSVSSLNLGENISITADPNTNSLIIYSGKTDYEKLRKLLEEIDVKRKQVLVEAMIFEVAARDAINSSVSFAASAGGDDGGVFASSSFAGANNLATLFSDPTRLSDFSMAAASAGTLTLPGGIQIPTQTVLLNAAQRNENVNILSAPTILATDNEQAEIVVGENVPFLASTATSDANINNTFNQVDRQDVGITLRITPQISSGDVVRLNVFTEVSDVVESTLTSPLGPTTKVRTSETTVIAKDGQMFVIGGLMGDDSSSADDGIPFLKNIPVFGHLFKSQSRANLRSNLLIFITPRIIRDQFDAREATIEKRDSTTDMLARSRIQPDRNEVLYSKAIDKVSEIRLEDEGIDPGTIDGRRISRSFDLSASDTMDVRVGAAGAANMAPVDPEHIAPTVRPRARMNFPELPSDVPQGNITILQSVGNQSLSGLPFRASGSGLLAVQSPNSTGTGKNYFTQGREYLYASDGKQARFRVLGSYPSIPDALHAQPGLEGEVHMLSPYEALNFGKGPWKLAGQ